LEGGRFEVKRVVGDTLEVSADVFKDGHDLLAAAVLFRAESEPEWQEVPMRRVSDVRFVGHFLVDSNERYFYTVAAWVDRYETFRRDLRKRLDARQDVAVELAEGEEHLRAAAAAADPSDRARLERALRRAARTPEQRTRAEILLADEVCALVSRWGERALLTRREPALPLWVDRTRARFASWYEFFPRSEGARAGRSGTFRDAEARLPYVRDLGFEVVYLPPIHPVGETARKGPNNTLDPGPDDPGSPWAIGSSAGGHTAVDPGLGTLADFDHFVAAADALGLEVALDFAVQCSPDHPWTREHPEWFFHRPDGSIKYAENPPKKYQDIYPLNFWGPHRAALWAELLGVLEFWIARGVRTFRVDNPHTKPLAMWEWLIRRVRAQHPEVVFLAEAFTAAWMMRGLARVGFSESYTYFTWKTSKHELTEYLQELTRGEMREYFRGNLWPNTPDILHAYLQRSRRPAFKIRAVLAATLSSLWGIYAGFELMENVPVREGSEEYLDSEKYQYRPRDFDQPDSLAPFIARLNTARRENRALQLYDNLTFVHADDPNVLAYVKATPDGSNVLLAVVNVDPIGTHASDLWIDPALLGVGADETYAVRDLLSDEVYTWRGGRNWVQLDPFMTPAHLLRVERGGAPGGHGR
jgi:starch synthase (maltosyl-transferring)